MELWEILSTVGLYSYFLISLHNKLMIEALSFKSFVSNKQMHVSKKLFLK